VYQGEAPVWCAHQIHGGIGFTEEHGLHIYTKHAKGWELMMGNALEHRAIVASEMNLYYRGYRR
jgi:alkylation response protein AidB-like acyl-CoA dehydrogenase